MRGSAPRPAGGNNFPRAPLICPLRMPKGRRRKGRRARPSTHPPSSASPLPPFLQRFAIIRRTPLRVVRAAWGHAPVALETTFPTVAPPRAFCVPQVPVSCVFPSSSCSSVARAPLLPLPRNRGALRPAFPQAPSVLPASFLPPSLRSLSPERPHSPPRRRSSLTPRAPFATRSPSDRPTR